MRKHLILVAFATLAWHCQKTDISEAGNLVPRTTTEDPALPSLQINGVRLHAETFGDIHHPILIFVHGGPGGDYRALISEAGIENASAYPAERSRSHAGLTRLQENFFCVFFDQRGAGLSPRFDRGKVKIEDYLDDLDAIVEHFLDQKEAITGQRDQQVLLFGWSFGGYLATAYVNTHPEKVKDLVLYEARPFTEEAFDLLTVTSPFQQLNEEYVDEFITGSTYLLPNQHNAMDYQQAVGVTGRFFPEFHNAPDLPFWRQGFVVNQEVEQDIRKRKFQVTNRLALFEGRMLYVYGSETKRDAMLPGYLELICSYFPHSTTAEIMDTGHSGVWEKSAEVAEAVQQFL